MKGINRYIIAIACVAGALMMNVSPLRADTREMRFRYYYWEAMHLMQEEQYEDAIRLLEYCDLLRPGDAEVSRMLGIYHYNNNREALALRLFESAYRTSPATAWYEYSTALMQSDDKKQQKAGLRVLETTARQLPGKSEVWDRLQSAYIKAERWKEVLQVQDTLDRLNGYDIYSAQLRFQVHLAMKKEDAALADLERYLEEDETNMQVMMLYVQYKERQGGGLRALEPVYQRALRLDPFNGTLLNNYAYALVTDKGFAKLSPDEKKERLQQAEVMVRRALTQEPENLSYKDTYAWILHLEGNNDLAKMYMRTVVAAYLGQKIPKEVKAHANAIFK